MDYRVRMALPDGLLPFTIPVKAGRYHGRTKYVPTHSIKEIIEHSEAECVCISVDTDDHLYVTENFILTHNTIQAILASENMTRSGLISRVLIICPASLKGQWQREIEEVAGSEAVCFHNAKDYVNFYLKNKRFPLYSIFSYEFLKRNIDLALIEKWGLIILDEAQKIKNPETKAYKTISTIPTDYLFMLTGTPVEIVFQTFIIS